MVPNQTLLPYRLEGNGYPLLLIHGLGVTHSTWQNLIPLLAPHFQLIMVELPGTGTLRDAEFTKPYYPTCAEALEDLRIALGIEQWTILAYSTGTRVCETYLRLYPGASRTSRFPLPFLYTQASLRVNAIFFRDQCKARAYSELVTCRLATLWMAMAQWFQLAAE